MTLDELKKLAEERKPEPLYTELNMETLEETPVIDKRPICLTPEYILALIELCQMQHEALNDLSDEATSN